MAWDSTAPEAFAAGMISRDSTTPEAFGTGMISLHFWDDDVDNEEEVAAGTETEGVVKLKE